MELHEIEKKAKEIIEKAKSDKNFHAELKKNPVKAVENLLGTDLPDEQIKAIAEAAKAKLSMDDGIEGVKEKLEGIFHKK